MKKQVELSLIFIECMMPENSIDHPLSFRTLERWQVPSPKLQLVSGSRHESSLSIYKTYGGKTRRHPPLPDLQLSGSLWVRHFLGILGFGFSHSATFGQSITPFGSHSLSVSTTSPFGTHSSSSGSQARAPTFGNTHFGRVTFGGQHGGSRVAPYSGTADIVGGKLVSISAMPAYKEESHEELRSKDYQLGDKGGIGMGTSSVQLNPSPDSVLPSSPVTSTAFSPTSIPASAPAFQSNSSPFLFGPSSSTSCFGPNSSTFVFGPSSSISCFGPTRSTSLSGPSSSTSGFQPNSSPSIFGPSNTASGFAPTSSSFIFGPSTSTSGFGPNNSPSSFGPSNSAPGFRPNSSPSIFGPSSSTSGFRPISSPSIFGPSSSTSGFRPISSPSIFGPSSFTPNSASNSTSAFGPNIPASIFGPSRSTSGFGPTSSSSPFGPSFSTPSFGPNSSSSIFRPSNSTPGFVPNSSSSTFGPSNSTPGFGPNSSPSIFGPYSFTSGFGPTSSSFIFSPSSSTSGFGPFSPPSIFGPSSSTSDFGPYSSPPLFAPPSSSILSLTSAPGTNGGVCTPFLPAQTAQIRGSSGDEDVTGGSSQHTTAQQLPAQNTEAIQPSFVASPFGTLPAASYIGSTTSIRHGISSLPVSDKQAPVRISSSLTIRHLSQRRNRLPTRKYDPKNDGPKVPFFRNDCDTPSREREDSLIFPRENPRSLVIRPTEQWALRINSETLSSLSHSSTHLYEDGKVSVEMSAPLPTSSIYEYEDGNSNENSTGKSWAEDVLALMPKLRSPGYYTEPEIEELATKERAEPGFCSHVKDFVVGRSGYGSIKFWGETDVRGLDIESLIQFNKREVIVYMNESKKPPVGEGLNKPAEVTLLNIKCMEKKTGKQHVDGPKVEKYREILINKSRDQGAEFVSYDPTQGVWKFRVNHFN